MATTMMMKSFPLIISTIFNHYTRGPPQPSWSLKLHLSFNITKSTISNLNGPNTIEELQGRNSILANSVDPNFKIDKIIIPHEYRVNAQEYIEKLIKPYEIAIDPIWKSPRSDGIDGEMAMNKAWNLNDQENDWGKEKIVLYLHGGAYVIGSLDYCRELVCELSKATGARILSINYRLAPQQSFPAGLCDVLAAYLYLTNPPDDSGFKPYKSNQIVICGDSAGGGLSVSLGLILRDLGLPPPAGIVALSPCLDFTHSFPSFFDPNLDETDLLPRKPGFIIGNDPKSIAYNEHKSSTRIILRKIQQHPDIKLIGDDSLKRIGEPVNYYIVNEGFGIPYVSPVLAESLGGLPPMLIITGNSERFRDEAIYFSYRAANPEKYRLPAYEIDFDNSRFKTPTTVTLEVYDEMFHCFQHSKFIEASKLSINRVSNFISNVTEAAQADHPPHSFNALKISYHGEVQSLDESSIEHVLKWDKVGVYPFPNL